MSKKIAIPAIAIVIGLLFTINQVSAHGFVSNNDMLVSKLAEAFGKSEEEVQVVLDEIRVEHQQEMLSRFETRLDEAVASGDITAEQKQLIMDKHAEMRLTHEEMLEEKQALSPEEWQATRQAQHDELEAWAEENGIDESFFMMGKGPRFEDRGMRGAF